MNKRKRKLNKYKTFYLMLIANNPRMLNIKRISKTTQPNNNKTKPKYLSKSNKNIPIITQNKFNNTCRNTNKLNQITTNKRK